MNRGAADDATPPAPAPVEELAIQRDLAARAATHRAAAYVSFFEPVTARFADRLVERLGPPVPDGVAVDLGAGGGALAAAVAAAGWRVVALDHDLALARRCAGRGIPVLAGDAQALPFAAGSVEVAVAGFLLPHLTDLDAALTEVTRVLRPGGRLLALGWTSVDRSPFTGVASRLLADHASADVRQHLARARSRTEPAVLREAAQRAGLHADVVTLTDSVALDSAAAWWRGMVAASTGFAELLTTQPAAVRTAVEDRFRLAAARFATGAGERLRVPVAAHLVVAERRR